MSADVLPKAMECEQAEQRLRIAVVYSRLPFPMMRGDQMTVAHLLAYLAKRGHTVDLYTLDLDGEVSEVQHAWLQEACRTVRVFRHSRASKVWGLVRGSMRLLPLQVAIFWNRAMAHELRRSLGQAQYDIVYNYYPRTAPAVEHAVGSGGTPKTFLALQLSQTLNTRRMAQHESRWFWRLVYNVEARLMGRYESRVWQRFDRTMLIGPADVQAIEQQCREHGQPTIDNWLYGAHGTDTTKYLAATDEEIVENRVVFSGSMLYPPNVQAALWFVDRVWPLVRSEVPEASFFIQGRDPVDEVRALDGRDGIVVTGTVPDVGEIIRSAAVCVNPMLAAGGMQNKLLEYMASAKAVVASNVANEGIRAPDSTLRVADDPREFAREVVVLLRDPVAASALGQRASDHVRTHWTWESHFRLLEEAFVDELGADHPSTPG
ncbi:MULTISPECIES: glycosyltransferase family 4 protein [unclassified Aeromicrobium]|uniref:glycosyltransferase family 4 protein n=1 Tax=unclassified Aeromicrobium TaxID=2633570 RepID=UPI00288905C1|nr:MULTISPECIES: glycosyltransferase family 4 protein [unclassified Aeromicrobium]